MPGLAYANFERTGPVVERFNSGATLSGFGYTNVAALGAYGELELLDGYGDFGEYGVVATAKNLKRLRSKLKRKRLALKKAEGSRKKKRLRKQIKRIQAKIARLIAKKKRQIKRRREKGKKLTRRQIAASQASRAIRRARRRQFRGATTAVPRWYLPKEKRKTRVSRWSSLTPKQRRNAFKRWQRRRAAARAGSGGSESGQQLQPLMPQFMPSALEKSGSTWESQWEQGPSSTEGGYPSAIPDYTESDDYDDEGGGGAQDQLEDDMDAIQEDSASNKLWLWGGLALAGAAGVYFLSKRKGAGEGKKKKRSGRAR